MQRIFSAAGPDCATGAAAAAPRLGIGLIAALAALVYLVLLGGTAVGELTPAVAAANAVVAAPLWARYLWRGPREADRVDRLILVAILLFSIACVTSQFLRQSFEAAMAAVTYGATFFVARGVLRRSGARRLLMWTLIGLSGVLTALTAARWGTYLFEWMALVDWRATPPFNMELPSIPWGHRHDLALLVVMLYPAWWIGRPSAPRKVLAVLVGILVAAVVFVGGSRMLWLAIVAASVLTAMATLRRRAGSWPRVSAHSMAAAVGVIFVAVVLLAITGLATTLVQRVADFESVGWRTAMWSALREWWIDNPIVGGGPGSFPWLLQGTEYFDTTSFAPRHPDSAPIQLLAEGGLVGLAAMAMLILAILPRLLACESPGAMWALLTFAAASIGSNPTDFAFLVVVAIVWAAYALPRPAAPPAAANTPRSRHVARGITAAAAVVVSTAWLITVAGSLAYSNARASISDGNLVTARDELNTALAFDPGMGIYGRQRGTLELVVGDPAAGLGQLEIAATINPHDDLAWRTLASAARASGDATLEERALAAALDLQRSDPANLLLSARLEASRGESEVASDLLAEAVQAWPAIVYAQGWDAYVEGLGLSTDRVVDRAATRWLTGLPGPEMVSDQGLWLAVLSGRDDAIADALEQSGYSSDIGAAMVALLRCEPATATLDGAPSASLRSSVYWRLRIRNAALANIGEGTARDLLDLMTRQRLADMAGPLNPLHEASVRGTSTDLWGYRRAAISWPSVDVALPSPSDGLANWTNGADCDR